MSGHNLVAKKLSMNLKISDNFNEIKTNNKITQVQPSDYELLTYEEAIEKAGGFGTY